MLCVCKLYYRLDETHVLYNCRSIKSWKPTLTNRCVNILYMCMSLGFYYEF
jgi:hypothetical protein